MDVRTFKSHQRPRRTHHQRRHRRNHPHTHHQPTTPLPRHRRTNRRTITTLRTPQKEMMQVHHVRDGPRHHMEPKRRIELLTYALRVRCSTN